MQGSTAEQLSWQVKAQADCRLLKASGMLVEMTVVLTTCTIVPTATG